MSESRIWFLEVRPWLMMTALSQSHLADGVLFPSALEWQDTSQRQWLLAFFLEFISILYYQLEILLPLCLIFYWKRILNSLEENEAYEAIS